MAVPAEPLSDPPTGTDILNAPEKSLMKKPHRLRAVTYLATLAMLFSLCAGIMITDSAIAKSGRRRPHKVSTDLGDDSGSGDLVKVVLQLNDKPSAQLKKLLK